MLRIGERSLPRQRGRFARAGGEIAKAGSTGRSTGVHVHLEVWRDGAYVDPARFMRGGNGSAIEHVGSKVCAKVDAGNDDIRRGKEIAQREADAIDRCAANRKRRNLRQPFDMRFLRSIRVSNRALYSYGYL